MAETTPTFTYGERLGGDDGVDFLIEELREGVGTGLGEAAMSCPHEAFICTACTVHLAMDVLRELLNAERV